MRLDCDGDTVLYRVRQTGPRLPHGARTCFVSRLEPGRRPAQPVPTAAGTCCNGSRATCRPARRRSGPRAPTRCKLLDAGLPKVSQKVGEEAIEVVVAANAKTPDRLASETADLLYHLLVLLQARGVPLDAVWRELDQRTR